MKRPFVHSDAPVPAIQDAAYFLMALFALLQGRPLLLVCTSVLYIPWRGQQRSVQQHRFASLAGSGLAEALSSGYSVVLIPLPPPAGRCCGPTIGSPKRICARCRRVEALSPRFLSQFVSVKHSSAVYSWRVVKSSLGNLLLILVTDWALCMMEGPC